jgi:hypothetical protein
MSDVRTQRIYSWALETGFYSAVDDEAVTTAAGQYRGAGGAQVWLLDASPAPAASPTVVTAIVREVAALRGYGLNRVAIVVPAIVRPFLAAVEPQVSPVRVYPFSTRDEAVEWLRRGCR